MTGENSELSKRIDELRSELHEAIVSNDRQHDEVFTRIRHLETTIATAQGVKAGIIFSFSLMWAVAVAAAAALWRWLK